MNYDAAMKIDTHVHRCGRTGRMGQDGVELGTAHTLVIHKEVNFAADLCANLQLSGQVRCVLACNGSSLAAHDRVLIYHACNGVAARARRPDCGCQAQQALQTCGWGVEPRRRRPRVCVTWHGCGRPRRWPGRRSGGSDSFVAGMAAWRGSTTCQAHDDGLRGKLQGRDASSSHRAPAAAARRIRLCHKLGWCVGRPHCGLA